MKGLQYSCVVFCSKFDGFGLAAVFYCHPDRGAQLAEAVSRTHSQYQNARLMYIPGNSNCSSLDEETQEKLTQLLERLWEMKIP